MPVPDQGHLCAHLPEHGDHGWQRAHGTAIGTWSLVSGTGTITDPNDPATVITDLQGVNVFAWTIVNGPCDTTTNTVTVFVYDAAQPPASAGPDQGALQS